MTSPEPNEPVQRSLPEPEDLSMELEAPEDEPGMAAQQDSALGTEDQS